MPRIRSIKPEFWSSEDIAALPIVARLTFVGLWTYVDDNGVGVFNERLIASTLYPMDDPRESLANVRESLAKLRDRGLISLYETGGRRFLYVTRWDEHQRVDKPGKYRYPRPEEAEHTPVDPEPTSENPDSRETSANVRETPANPRECVANVPAGNREQGAGSREQGKEGSATCAATRHDVERLCSELHQRITANGSKAAITESWKREARLLLDRDGRPLSEALKLIQWCQDHEFWHTNILGMSKFRKQYDKLRLQSEQANRPRANTHQQRIDALAAYLDPNEPDPLNPEQPPALRAIAGGVAS